MAQLCFQTAFPGDVFLSIPLLKRMRVFEPAEDIVLACRPGLGEFFKKFKLVDEVIEVDKKNPTARKKALKDLRSRSWSVVVCPHESVRTALWMLGVRATTAKIGYQKWWNGLVFSHRVEKPHEYPEALRQLSLLAPIDGSLAEHFAEPEMSDLKNPFSHSSPLDLSMPIIPEWASMKVIDNHSDGRTVFLAPGSVWGTKRWTASGYAGLAHILRSRNFHVVLVGSQAERALCEEIANEVPGVDVKAGKTSFSELVELLATGVAIVCNDSGAMHAAAAADLPTVAIFGPTTLNLGFRPWNMKSVVVQRQVKCRPCGRHGPQICPIGTHECMTHISAEDVYVALANMMKKK